MDHRHQKDMDLLDTVTDIETLDNVIAELDKRLKGERKDMEEAVQCFGEGHKTNKSKRTKCVQLFQLLFDNEIKLISL